MVRLEEMVLWALLLCAGRAFSPTGSRSYTTAFQAELTVIITALQHANEGHTSHLYIFTDPLAALDALRHTSRKDNVQLLSAIQLYLATLYRDGTTLSCHWVP